MNGILDNVLGDTVQTVIERLAETTAWCAPRVNTADPKHGLRTESLRPHPLERDRKAVVASVAIARYVALRPPSKSNVFDLMGGRLLIYEPDVNLAHGLEESETNGYVDLDNIPPWDTWIAYIYETRVNYLLSWVPGPFVSLVSDGIKVSPEECIRWLDDTDFDLRPLLERKS